MALKINYTKRAAKQLDDLLSKIEEDFGNPKAVEVYNKVEKELKKISKMNRLFEKVPNRKNIHRCVVSKQTSIYYRIKPTQIQVIRVHPNKKVKFPY